MLSRDERLTLGTWNTIGPQENVVGDQCSTFDSLRNHRQGIHHSTTPSATGSVTGRLVARDEDRNEGTVPVPTFAGRPSTMSSLFPVDIPQNSVVGQQRQQISELQFDKIPYTFYNLMLEDKIRQKPSDYMF